MKIKRGILFFLIFVAAAMLFVAMDAYAENMSAKIADGLVRMGGTKTDGCWFCSIFAKIFCTGNGMSISLYKYLGVECTKLAAVIMAFWFAWMALKLFLGFSAAGTDFFSEFSSALFRLVIATSILLTPPSFVFDYYSVLIKTAADFSSLIMQAGTTPAPSASGQKTPTISNSPSSEGQEETSSGIDPARIHIENFKQSPIGYNRITPIETLKIRECTSSGEGFTYESVASVMRMLQAIHLQIIRVMIVGKYLYDYSWEEPFSDLLFKIPNGFIIPGVLIILTCMWILVTCVLKIMNAIVQLMFVCTLTPLFIMFWIFPVTRGYTSQAIKTFITVIFMFIITAILLTMALMLISNVGYVRGSNRLYPVDHSLLGLFQGSGYRARQYFNMSGNTFFVFICASIVAVKLVGLVPSLSETLGGANVSGGPGDAFQAFAGKLASKGAEVAKKAAKATVKTTGTALKKGAAGAKEFANAKAAVDEITKDG